MNYTSLTLAEVEAEFSAVARDTKSLFGLLDERQLNWRRDATSWSVAQCFDHLLNINREMFQAIDAAVGGSRPPTVWQRLPVLPRIFGSMMIKSQMPESKRKFKAPRKGSSGVERDRPAHHRALRRLSARGRRARPLARRARRGTHHHGVALRLVHHLQRARWLPADRDARAASFRAGEARDPGTWLPGRGSGVVYCNDELP